MPEQKSKRIRPTFQNSVFVNCPFDEQYRPLFQALIFTIQDCGFVARCSLEVEDSGDIRANRIIQLVKTSRFGIHDISRTELSSGLPRFNMPYELGIFMGLKHSGDKRQQTKRGLILDKAPYRYQQFLSDIAGQDIRSHDEDVEKLIQEVRHFLQNQTRRSIHGVKRVINRFELLQLEIPKTLEKLHKSEEDLNNYHDFHSMVCDWIEVNPLP